MKVSVSQIEVFQAVVELATSKNKSLELTDRQSNALLAECARISATLAEKDLQFSPGMGINNWLNLYEASACGMALAYHLMQGAVKDKRRIYKTDAIPRDSFELGQCIRFLEAEPRAKKIFTSAMIHVSEKWSNLIGQWSTLEHLYGQVVALEAEGKTSAQLRSKITVILQAIDKS